MRKALRVYKKRKLYGIFASIGSAARELKLRKDTVRLSLEGKKCVERHPFTFEYIAEGDPLYLEVEKECPELGVGYTVTNFGRVRRAQGGFLPQRRDRKGRAYLSVYRNDERVAFFVDKLVANAFVPNPEGHRFIRHINGLAADSTAPNLLWCSYEDSKRPGVAEIKALTTFKPVRAYKEGVLVGEFLTVKETARALDLSTTTVSNYLAGKVKKPRHCYHFEHVITDEGATC